MHTVESKQDEAGIVENSNIPEVKKKKPAKGQETGIKDSKDGSVLEAKGKDLF